MRVETPLSYETTKKLVRFTIAGMDACFEHETRRLIPRNSFDPMPDVRDLLPDVVVPLGDIWPRSRNRLKAQAVRAICPARWCVYVVRSSDEVLYVGMTSSGFQRRLAQHVYGRTELGDAIRYGRPSSLDFMTEQYLMPDKTTALRYEAEMIQYREPTLNIAQNISTRRAA